MAASFSNSDAVLNELKNQYNNLSKYKAKTPEELRTRAENEYQSYYDQLRLSAQQAQQAGDLRLQQEYATLQDMYAKQSVQSEAQYKNMYSTSNNQMLQRGMQRSSYGAQTLANITLKGAQAQQGIQDQQAAAAKDIEDQRTLYVQQLADQLEQHDSNEAADILARMQELEDMQYAQEQQSLDRQNALSMQIYQTLYQKERDAIADSQWQQQFDKSTSRGGGGGGGGGSGGGSGSGTVTTTTNPYDALMAALYGYNNTPKIRMSTTKEPTSNIVNDRSKYTKNTSSWYITET